MSDKLKAKIQEQVRKALGADPESEPTPPNPFTLWDEKTTAIRLGVSVRKLQADRLRGVGVPYVKVGRAVRYRPDTVESWIIEQERKTSGEPAA